MEDTHKSSYGKRPLWQWIVIYVIVGGVIYFLIYFFFFGNKGSYNEKGTNTPQQQNTPGY